MFHSHRIHRRAIACAIALALASPGTALAQQDLRSPDARDAASTQQQRDVSSPQIFTDEQRATAERYTRSPAYQATLREVRAANAPQPAQVRPDDGLDWVDAGIGAAGMLAVMLIALGGVVAVSHHRPAATR